MLEVPHSINKCFWKGQQCLESLWMQPLEVWLCLQALDFVELQSRG